MDDVRTIEVVALQDQGRVRAQQEDSCHARVQDHWAWLIVADGMGGHVGGALASQLAVQTIEKVLLTELTTLQLQTTNTQARESVETSTQLQATEQVNMNTHKLPETVTDEQDRVVAELLRRAVQTAQTAICALAIAQPAAAGDAGSTLTVALVHGHRVHIAHVGDSRAYLWRSPALRQLTHDHSAAALLVAVGAITAEEARHHPESSTLYQFLGITGKPLVIEILHEPVAVGDRLLLCSDGLWNMVVDGAIAALVGREIALTAIAQALIDTANTNGGAGQYYCRPGACWVRFRIGAHARLLK